MLCKIVAQMVGGHGFYVSTQFSSFLFIITNQSLIKSNAKTNKQTNKNRVSRQIHEGLYLSWLHKAILRLSHLFQIS